MPEDPESKIGFQPRTRADSLRFSRATRTSTLPGESMADRPSKHDPFTKSYAIDQINDIERLRAVAHRMREAFAACHEQSAHIIGALVGNDGCERCARALYEEGQPCDRYDEWQKKITDGFGSV